MRVDPADQALGLVVIYFHNSSSALLERFDCGIADTDHFALIHRLRIVYHSGSHPDFGLVLGLGLGHATEIVLPDGQVFGLGHVPINLNDDLVAVALGAGDVEPTRHVVLREIRVLGEILGGQPVAINIGVNSVALATTGSAHGGFTGQHDSSLDAFLILCLERDRLGVKVRLEHGMVHVRLLTMGWGLAFEEEDQSVHELVHIA